MPVGFLEHATESEEFNSPEAANSKCAFARLGFIPKQQSVAGAEMFTYLLICGAHALRTCLFKAIPRDTQQRGIHSVTIQHARVAFEPVVPGPIFNLLPDAAPFACKPLAWNSRDEALLLHGKQAVKGRPTEQ